jgi:quercetin dioxygenase-like cupin family protein
MTNKPGDDDLVDESIAGSIQPQDPPPAARARLLSLVAEVRNLRGLTPVPHTRGITGKVVVRESGKVTVLLQFAPGGVMPGHGHKGEEQSYVVSGSCRFGDRMAKQGDFIAIAAGTSHGDIVSDSGCVLLVVADERDYRAA